MLKVQWVKCSYTFVWCYDADLLFCFSALAHRKALRHRLDKGPDCRVVSQFSLEQVNTWCHGSEVSCGVRMLELAAGFFGVNRGRELCWSYRASWGCIWHLEQETRVCSGFQMFVGEGRGRRVPSQGTQVRHFAATEPRILMKCSPAIITFVPLNSLTSPWPRWMPAAQSRGA